MKRADIRCIRQHKHKIDFRRNTIMRINTNTAAMNTYSNLTSANASKSNSLAKLSSGLRINKAGDDAAGLSISEKMKNQISGMTQASRNAQDGISLIQTAEGALSETHSILNRMRDLTVQAGNGTNTDDDKSAIQKEITSLTKEVERIANDTQFNTKGLMNAAEGITASSLEESDVNMDQLYSAYGDVSGVDTESDIDATSFTNQTDAAKAALLEDLSAEDLDSVVKLYNAKGAEGILADTKYDIIDSVALTEGNDMVTTDGAVAIKSDGFGENYTRKANFAAAYNEAMNENLNFDEIVENTGTAGISAENFDKIEVQYTKNENIRVANETIAQNEAIANSQIKTSDIKESSSNDFTFQIGANAGENIKISIGDMTSKGLKIDTLDITGDNYVATEKDTDGNFLTVTDAALKTIDSAIKSVSEERANLGATQNRLDHTVSNLATTKENLSEANSRITDVDMAEEMMSFTKSNILSQASTSMLAQANQMPQSVLSLLQ